MIRPSRIAPLLALLALVSPASAQEVIESEKTKFKFAPFVDGLNKPYGMVELPDGKFLVTEKPGGIRVIEGGKLVAEPIKNVPTVEGGGQGGLFDIQIHPDYAKNGWIYLAFSEKKGPGKVLTKVVRGKIKNGAWTGQETIFEAPAEQYVGGGVHYGGRIQFDGKGYIFFSVGDRGDTTTPANTAQKLTTVRGKIHRLFDDGRIPPDNPFVNEPGAMKSIWSWGHRNPQGLHFDDKGNLWETEHGPRGGDEMNLIVKGKNYGWPLVTYGINYSGSPITDKRSAPGFESPRINWTPSIAASGLAYYNGDKFPAWKGSLFAGALGHAKVVRAEVDAQNNVTHEEILLKGKGRVRSILAAKDGTIYIVYQDDNKIMQLQPAD